MRSLTTKPDSNFSTAATRRLVFTAAEAAQALNTSVKTIYRLCQKNRLTRCQGIRTYRIPRSSIEDYLKGD